MEEAQRITPEEARPKVKSGKAVLVCAYNDEEAFKKMMLEGAISYSEFFSCLPRYVKNLEVIFYCA